MLIYIIALPTNSACVKRLRRVVAEAEVRGRRDFDFKCYANTALVTSAPCPYERMTLESEKPPCCSLE